MPVRDDDHSLAYELARIVGKWRPAIAAGDATPEQQQIAVLYDDYLAAPPDEQRRIHAMMRSLIRSFNGVGVLMSFEIVARIMLLVRRMEANGAS